jgi:hypothetical protein
LHLAKRPNPDIAITHRIAVILQLDWTLQAMLYKGSYPARANSFCGAFGATEVVP